MSARRREKEFTLVVRVHRTNAIIANRVLSTALNDLETTYWRLESKDVKKEAKK